MLDSGAPVGTDTVQVANNSVSSVKNRTVNRWCGVQAEGWPDKTVLSVAPDSNVAVLPSSADNVIDHFYVRASTGKCDR